MLQGNKNTPVYEEWTRKGEKNRDNYEGDKPLKETTINDVEVTEDGFCVCLG